MPVPGTDLWEVACHEEHGKPTERRSRMSPEVVVFGSINLDLVFEMEALPGPGQTRLAGALSIQPGGKGASPRGWTAPTST